MPTKTAYQEMAAEILRTEHGVTGPVTAHETWGASIVVEVGDLFIKANGDRSTTAETLVAQRVRAAGVPVPEIIDAGTDDRLPGGDWIVMRRMPGTGFAPRAAHETHIPTTIADMARYLTMLRDVTLPGFGWVGDDGVGTSSSWPEWLHRQVDERTARLGPRLLADFVGAAHAVIDKVAPDLPRGSILNGDLGLSHVLVDAAGHVTGLLDWAAAVIGDPLFDVATFSMGGPAGDPIQVVLQPQLLTAYGADLDDPRLPLYRAINHLANAVWCIDNDIPSWLDDLCRAAGELLRS